MSQRRKRPRKIPLGKPLPPAPDEEFSPESLRAFGEQQTAQWWKRYTPARYRQLLEAQDSD